MTAKIGLAANLLEMNNNYASFTAWTMYAGDGLYDISMIHFDVTASYYETTNRLRSEHDQRD